MTRNTHAPERTEPPPLHRRALSAVVTVVAMAYFLIDALAYSILKPLLARIGRHPLVLAAGRWIAALGPYPTLVMVLLPLVLLEPIKIYGVYLLTQHPAEGIALVAIGELLKIVTVERLFHIGRDKLLTIRWFAWGYRHVTGWLKRLRASRAWQAVRRIRMRTKAAAKRLLHRIKRGILRSVSLAA